MHKPVILIILDGWGYREESNANAIVTARTPFYDSIWKKYPHALLKASGEAVGLPEGQMGNSEVGHITIGAGKSLDTDLVRINKAVFENKIKENQAIVKLFSHIKKYDSVLHLLGLIGPGGVHAHENHLFGILKAAKCHGIDKIAIHAFTDGRDTAPKSSSQFLQNIEEMIANAGIGFLATASGRFYAMDRDKNWDRIKKAEDAIFNGIANRREKKNPSKVLNELYGSGVVDEHLEPVVFLDQNDQHYQFKQNDGVLFLNFRADRSRQLSHRIAEKTKELNLHFVTLTQYDPKISCDVAFPPETISTTLGAEISRAGLKQVHIAETEKFAHATYYLNGGKQEPHDGEEHVLIESRKDVDTHDKAPEMRANEIANQSCKFLDEKIPFVFINFANPDMVGHTGNSQALLKAIEIVDSSLEMTVNCALKNNYTILITADHGNAEIGVDENGEPHTAHSTNDVPAILLGSNYKIKNGSLKDIAPTILNILKLPIPSSMTGSSLLKNCSQSNPK